MGNYSIESVIDGVGYLQPDEELAVCAILDDGASVYFDGDSNQVHLCWSTSADTLDEAIDISRRTLRIAKHAAAVLALDSSKTLDPRRPLKEYGLDSLMALDLARAIARPPVAARTSRAIVDDRSRGSTSVRATHVNGKSRLLRAVIASLTCASGTYAIGSGFRFHSASRGSATAPTIWRGRSRNSAPAPVPIVMRSPTGSRCCQ